MSPFVEHRRAWASGRARVDDGRRRAVAPRRRARGAEGPSRSRAAAAVSRRRRPLPRPPAALASFGIDRPTTALRGSNTPRARSRSALGRRRLERLRVARGGSASRRRPRAEPSALAEPHAALALEDWPARIFARARSSSVRRARIEARRGRSLTRGLALVERRGPPSAPPDDREEAVVAARVARALDGRGDAASRRGASRGATSCRPRGVARGGRGSGSSGRIGIERNAIRSRGTSVSCWSVRRVSPSGGGSFSSCRVDVAARDRPRTARRPARSPRRGRRRPTTTIVARSGV